MKAVILAASYGTRPRVEHHIVGPSPHGWVREKEEKKKMAQEVLEKAIEMGEYLADTRRRLHMIPELGLKGFKTSSLLKKELARMKVEVTEIADTSGLVGIIRGKKPGKGPVTALRADTDALPIKEQSVLRHASRNEGVMHACGHDGHTAGLLGAAKLLNAMRDRFSGTVKLLFQPGEETLEGARMMIASGVLENPRVDTVLALHSWPELKEGQVGIYTGPYMASADKFTVTLKGAGCHGALPHKSADPILASAHAVTALQALVSREVNALDPAVISVCMIQGGSAFNIIPREVTLCGTARCLDEELRRKLKEKIRRLIKGTASAFACQWDMEYVWGVPCMENHPEVVDLFVKAAQDVLGRRHVIRLSRPTMGSEDFSFFTRAVGRGAMAVMGLTKPGRREIGLHNECFDFNDKVLPAWAAVLTQFVLLRNR
jgi:amidohydrolase